ncbi:hypothetical protein K5D56_21690 [Pseudomonas cichorii]|nr:hypothetical protein [Pseudomonas cichorii]MBX8557081.1 hypothetical protein [Pseudomonas cichorii]MBX8591982.1 hypothetical protein [Pseudomonas cichorii]
MIVHFDAYSSSGHHHHIATLKPGDFFHGIYLITDHPTVVRQNDEEFYSFTASDLTGKIRCLIPTHRVHWTQSARFVSQRVAIEGRMTLINDDLSGMIRDLNPVNIIW